MKQSAGLLLWRRAVGGGAELLIGHMGGPYWAHKDEGAWSLPKGLAEPTEDDLLVVAEREFAEEMGGDAPDGPSVCLATVAANGKRVTIFAREGDFDVASMVSNTFEMQWPRGSGEVQSFPEIDRAMWAAPVDARRLLAKSQRSFVDRLEELLS